MISGAAAKKANPGCWVTPARASPAGTESLFLSWIVLGVLGSVLVPAMQKRGGEAGEGPEMGHKGHARAGKLPSRERLGGLGSAFIEEGLGENLSLCSSI